MACAEFLFSFLWIFGLFGAVKFENQTNESFENKWFIISKGSPLVLLAHTIMSNGESPFFKNSSNFSFWGGEISYVGFFGSPALTIPIFLPLNTKCAQKSFWLLSNPSRPEHKCEHPFNWKTDNSSVNVSVFPLSPLFFRTITFIILRAFCAFVIFSGNGQLLWTQKRRGLKLTLSTPFRPWELPVSNR